jgi:hypothetical protein
LIDEASAVATMNQSRDLEQMIAQQLRATGCYTGEMDPGTTQRIVDAQWAAHRAARGMGLKAQVSVRELRPRRGPATAILQVTTTPAAAYRTTRLLSA